MAKVPGFIMRGAAVAPKPAMAAHTQPGLPAKVSGPTPWRPIDARNPVKSQTQPRVTMGLEGAHFEPEYAQRYSGFAMLRLAEDHKAANPKDLVTLTLPGETRGSDVTVALKDSVAKNYIFAQTSSSPGPKAFSDARVFFDRSQLRKASVALNFARPSEYPNMRATSTITRDRTTDSIRQTLWVDLRGDGSVVFDLLNPAPALSKSNLNLHGLFGLEKPR